MKLLLLLISLNASANILQIEFNQENKFSSFKLPTGDLITYTRDNNNNLIRDFHQSSTIPLEGSSSMWSVPFVSPTRYPFSTEEIHAAYDHLKSDELYTFAEQDFMAEYTEAAFESVPLPRDIKRTLNTIVSKLRACAPQAHSLLKNFLDNNKIRSSSSLSDIHAAIVPIFSTQQIMLGSIWLRGMRNGKWDPLKVLERDSSRSAESDAIMRQSYFGDESVDLARFNHPSKHWKFAFALLHEVGHIIQHTHEHNREASLGFNIPFISYSKRFQGMTMFGVPDDNFMREYNAITNQFSRYKESVESGATYFALDALAGCSTKL